MTTTTTPHLKELPRPWRQWSDWRRRRKRKQQKRLRPHAKTGSSDGLDNLDIVLPPEAKTETNDTATTKGLNKALEPEMTSKLLAEDALTQLQSRAIALTHLQSRATDLTQLQVELLPWHSYKVDQLDTDTK